jgi:hypothetical protein
VHRATGAYGINTHSCSRIHSKDVSGSFSSGRRGFIDLEDLGRSVFSWTASGDGLAIDLSKNWQGNDAILYRARLTRDGNPKPAASAARDQRPLLSANALYREFARDSRTALARHAARHWSSKAAAAR